MINNKERILDKSTEAFVMAIEVYNKPSIKYRVEGFSMFICNAWELMLKAYMIEKFGEDSIYFKDNKDRTLSLENCIKKVFTNDKDPLRKNLEKIIELRNTSTHFITEEYEMVYVPLFQSCVFNFTVKMKAFHNIDLTRIVPQNFLTLSVSMKELDTAEVRAKYSGLVADKLLSADRSISELIDQNNAAFGLKIKHLDYITRKREEATDTLHISKNGEIPARIITELKNPNKSYKYSAKKCIGEINKCLESEGIALRLNSYSFNLFVNYYGIKQNDKLCFEYGIQKTPQYSYSRQTIDFIVEEIRKDPDNIIGKLRELLKNKLTPGAKDSQHFCLLPFGNPALSFTS